MKFGDTVKIEWVDSVSIIDSWVIGDEFDFDAHDKASYYTTVGFFLKRTKVNTYVCLSMRKDDTFGGNNWGRVWSIPNRAILLIRIIK